MIGILYSRVRLEEKLLFEAFRKYKKGVLSLDTKTINLSQKNKNNFKISILLNREVSQTKAELVLNFFEGIGIKTINSFSATQLCNNKALCSWMLQKMNVPTVDTEVIFSKEEAYKSAEELGYPLVIKPLIGSWGRLIAKVENKGALEALLEYQEALNNTFHSTFYLQKYIDKPGRDIRILVIGGEPVAAMYRVSKHWITNTARGSVPKKCKLTDELVKLAQITVQTIGTDIAGIDIVETEEGYKVLEVNSTVEFHGLQTVTNFSIADRIANYLVGKEKMI